jgi:hypothetical protein
VNSAFSDEFSRLFGLPRGDVRYRMTAGLAFCSREPCRSVALLLEPGQPVHLRHLSECQPDAPIIQVCVDRDDDRVTGRLYAVDAAMLSILYRFDLRNSTDRLFLTDRSILQTMIKQAPADQPGAKRLRYPKATLHLDLEMSEAWPLFTVLALLKIKDETPLSPVVLEENPWLQPILVLQNDYRMRGHDRFRLPRALSLAWFELTRF